MDGWTQYTSWRFSRSYRFLYSLTYTTDNIVTIFLNRDGKYSSKRLATLLAQLFKPFPNGSKYVDMYAPANTKESYPALVMVLNRFANDLKTAHAEKAAATVASAAATVAAQEQSIKSDTSGTAVPTVSSEPVHKRVSLFESPPLSSTRIIPDQVTPENVQEIKEKLVQATSNSASNRLSSSTSLPPGSMMAAHHHHNYPSLSRPAGFEFSHRKAPIVSWNFNYDELYPLQSKANVAAIPVASQEPIVLKEVLNCLIGIKGTLITPRKGTTTIDPDGALAVEFQLSNQLTESCRDMVVEVLPLAANYSAVQSFIEGASVTEGGVVLQALRSVLKTIMTDYYLSIAQLDDLRCRRGLSLQRLIQFLKPVYPTMEELAATVSEIRRSNARGGQVLSLLHDRITAKSGTNHAQKVLVHLVESAAAPFMEMLELWIYRGVINDPQQEFFIDHSSMELTENELVDYWEKQYTIRNEKVPCFLAKHADIILRTGKYLNVVRVCGGAEFQPGNANGGGGGGATTTTDLLNASSATARTTTAGKRLQYAHFDQSYLDEIEEAYNFASSSLLNLIMNKYDLMGRLLSVKRYFLLQQGDFITEFMDAVEEDLRKSVDTLHPIRLANLLDVTLGLSSAKYDEYHDDLKTMLLPYGIVTQISKIVNNEDAFVDTLSDTSQLKGVECFTFTYKAQWPVSIVLNLWTISKYQMIFRQLFYLKYVERILCRVWIANNETRQFAPNPAKLYRSAFTLRQKMLIAIQSFESYMMIEVIEPNWHIFYQNMKQVKNIDDVLNYHQDFLDQCLKNCMLTEPDLLKPIINLCNICIKFCDFLATATTMAPTETFSERVEQFRHDFTDQLMTLLRKIADVATLSTSERFINLIYRQVETTSESVPSVMSRPPITLSKRQKLDEVRIKLLANLYNKDEHNTGSENDHTYSEAKTDEPEQRDPLNGCKKSIYFLQRYPNVCAFCLRLMQDDSVFLPLGHFHDSLECTIEQKLDEITGDPMDQEDRSDVQNLLPDKVCEECLETLIKFHQYQRQLDCMKKFSTSIAHLLHGNPNPLENLYQDQGPYLVNVLRNLDIAQGKRINQSLEQVLEEVTSYGQDKQNLPIYAEGPADPRSFDQSSSTDDALSESMDTCDESAATGPAVYKTPVSARSGERTLEIYEVPHGNSRKRLAEKNETQKLHTCPYSTICQKWFLTEEAVQQHIREEHKSFDCHICGSKIAFYDLYQKHMESHTIARALLRSHNRTRALSESISSVISDESTQLEQKKRPKPTGNYVCGTCLGVFVDDQDFSSHRCSLASSTKLATPQDILLSGRNRNFTVMGPPTLPETLQLLTILIVV
uniref:Gamma-tubulin complex component 2 n=1 Tax=Anopheles melas TaxID=34690 RepID=A0A182TIE7_9DIPT